jgi:DNA-binding response OmpR family regulator
MTMSAGILGGQNRKQAILIVEPDRLVRDLMALAVERQEHPVITAGSWPEALALIQQEPPQLILLSMLLPEINGIDALQTLKSRGLLEKTRVIVVTALGYREVVERAVEAGASEFIVKPFDTGLLVEKVRKVLL